MAVWTKANTPLFYAEKIKDAVSCRQFLEFNNITVNRQGFAVCPFHGDKDASLKVYDNGRGWCCYGCHKGGDVINLARELYKVGFTDALIRMNSEFALGLDIAERPSKSDLFHFRVKQQQSKIQKEQEERERAALEKEYLDWTELFLLYDKLVVENEPKDKDEEWSPEFRAYLQLRNNAKDRAQEAQWRWYEYG